QYLGNRRNGAREVRMHNTTEWLWAEWDSLGLVVLSTTLMYIIVLGVVRLAGRRTVAQMSAFDFLVTIALGTIVGGTVVTDDPPVAQGLAAVITLLLLQITLGALRQRSPRLQAIIDFRPIAVLENGAFTNLSSPTSAQLTSADIESKLRSGGVSSLDDVALVVLEPDGSLSIFAADELDDELIRRVQERGRRRT
ncbi:MAG TPA: YetF domain-containing protein, partial [Actinomycetota bacterium]|nr:YetF domain-containing protein [Actinomycetota bacterium]